MKGTLPPVGTVFGRLTVLGPGKRQYHWLCKCSCGKIKEVNKFHIGKATKSCGCLAREWSKEGQKTHGRRRSLTYEIWASVKQRCLNPRNKDYKHYGERGITICERWMKFDNFLEDMGEKPEKHSIERIDTNKGYYKENCKWIEIKLQNRNKRNNRMLTCKGKTQSVIAWSEETKIPYKTLMSRLRYGWSTEKALFTPVKRRLNASS